MLRIALSGHHNTFNEVFHQARVLIHWVDKSSAFKKYVKRSLLGTIVANRFVDPHSKEIVMSINLQSVEMLHGIIKPTSKWPSNEELEYKALYKNIKTKLFKNILVSGAPVSEIALEKDRSNVSKIVKQLLLQFCKKYFQKYYSDNIEGLSAVAREDNPTHSNIIKEVILPLIGETSKEHVYGLFLPLIDGYEDTVNWDLDSEIHLFQSAYGNHNLENIIIPRTSLFSKIYHFNKLRNQFGDIELILNNLKLKKASNYENRFEPNTDHESKKNAAWTPAEDEFIYECTNRNFSQSEMLKYKGLEGRSQFSLKQRCTMLRKNNWKMLYKIHKVLSINISTNKKKPILFLMQTNLKVWKSKL
jgi:hypothetical protein